METSKAEYSTTVTTQHNQLSSLLLCLPGELRNSIYAYVIVDYDNYWPMFERGVMYLTSSGRLGRMNRPRKDYQLGVERMYTQAALSLQLVCQQLYRETRLLALSSRFFTFNSKRSFRFVNKLTPEQCSVVRRIGLEITVSRLEGHELRLLQGSFVHLEREFRATLRALGQLEKVEFGFLYAAAFTASVGRRHHWRNVLKMRRASLEKVVRDELRENVDVYFPRELWEMLPEAPA